MAPEHVAAFLRGVDAINRADVTAVLDAVHPEVVFEPARAATEGAFLGPEGMRRFLADTAEMFELFKAMYTDVRPLEDGRLLATGTIRMRARVSGVEADVPTAAIVEFRDGLMLHYKDYGNARAALQAVAVDG
jgi:ketosteroid isomerase-like protein